MTRTLTTLATAASTVMAMIISLGLIVTVNSAHAGGKPSEAYFVKVDRETTTSAKPSVPGRSARIKRAGGTVCCSMPRTGKVALIAPPDCRKLKGKIVNKAKCARVRRVSAARFKNLVLKRGMTSSSKPATPGALTTGGVKGVTCSNGSYYPCWCSGEEICNFFISACVEDGGEIGCTGHNQQTGEPNECACMK